MAVTSVCGSVTLPGNAPYTCSKARPPQATEAEASGEKATCWVVAALDGAAWPLLGAPPFHTAPPTPFVRRHQLKSLQKSTARVILPCCCCWLQFALEAFADTLQTEAGLFGVGVSVVAPAPIRTPMVGAAARASSSSAVLPRCAEMLPLRRSRGATQSCERGKLWWK